jgi:hypothetical protein
MAYKPFAFDAGKRQASGGNSATSVLRIQHPMSLCFGVAQSRQNATQSAAAEQAKNRHFSETCPRCHVMLFDYF